jgi:hypothetical protein
LILVRISFDPGITVPFSAGLAREDVNTNNRSTVTFAAPPVAGLPLTDRT